MRFTSKLAQRLIFADYTASDCVGFLPVSRPEPSFNPVLRGPTISDAVTPARRSMKRKRPTPDAATFPARFHCRKRPAATFAPVSPVPPGFADRAGSPAPPALRTAKRWNPPSAPQHSPKPARPQSAPSLSAEASISPCVAAFCLRSASTNACISSFAKSLMYCASTCLRFRH